MTAPTDSRARRATLAGRWGLVCSAISAALTFAVAVAGPSLMEPALPGGPGQPPWSLGAHPSAYVVVPLTAAAVAAGAAGLGLCLWAARRGWTAPARALLLAGIGTALALALVPPFGSGDHLNYAAYGHMVVTGHDPYTTTAAQLAARGDPVARAVTDWRGQRSVYGPLATGIEALAALAGGDSARLTVFALSLANVAAFAGAGLLLHRLAGGDQRSRARAALLWTANPLLLQVLIAGAHVDVQALAFGVAAVALFTLALRQAASRVTARAGFLAAAAAGVACAAAAAIKISLVLIPAGLLAAGWFAWRHASDGRAGARAETGVVAGLLAGSLAGGVVALVPWGARPLGTALRAGALVSAGSPWRVVRLLHFLIGERVAGDVVTAGALVLAVALVLLFAQPLAALAAGGPGPLVTACVLALTLAWLTAWPYVLPWYDALAWAPLALLPWLPAPWAALDGLLLARTTALALGYLPARGVALPPGLSWLEPVVRAGAVPALLLILTVLLVRDLWPAWRERARPGAGPVTGHHLAP